MSTKAGRKIITEHPNYQGSLGTAISEAIELAMSTPNCKYTLGSVLNHVSLHQTIIGLEAEKQMEMAGEYLILLSDVLVEVQIFRDLHSRLCVIPLKKVKKHAILLRTCIVS
jgi:predicted alternative tryptophan synthase beta-subunit